MAYVIYGCGAIGGIIAARLRRSGESVVVIARGANLEAVKARGLRFQSESEDWALPVTVVGHPREIEFKPDDVVILAMKTQDTLEALLALSQCAPKDTPVLCAQNGVENERIALRRFRNVYGMYLFIVGTNPAPGVVQCFTAPTSGVLNIGRYPSGSDDFADKVSAVLVAAGFDALVCADIMRWKYAKLLANLGNAIDAGCNGLEGLTDIYEAAQAEGVACLRAAGIDFISKEESLARHASIYPFKRVQGAPFPGGSAWQSLARGAEQTEIDYLTGEIVMLGRLVGMPTPINTILQDLLQHIVSKHLPPGSLHPGELRSLLAAVSP